MLQFDSHEIQQIRLRATSSILQKLEKDNHIILNSETLVPPDGRASWNLYYYCPHHGVRLIWDRHQPTTHICPVDNEVFSGEPYDNSWWRWLNDLNAKACYELGLLWQLTQQPVYLERLNLSYWPTLSTILIMKFMETFLIMGQEKRMLRRYVKPIA